MLSRIADSMYWMSRYIERSENLARILDVHHNLQLDLPGEADGQWRALVVTTGDAAAFEGRYGAYDRENVLQFLIADPLNPNSILSCLASARENARTMRESLSSEMWEQVNGAYLAVREVEHRLPGPDALHGFCRQIRMASHLFGGVTDATLSHGEGWNFIRLGRMFERADKTLRILDVKYFLLLPKVEDVGTPYDNILWTALLKSASASEMYRRKYHQILPARVAEFLLLDLEFPRSVRYCLVKSEESLRALSGTPPGRYNNQAEQQLGRLRAELDYAQVGEIIQSGLHEYLDAFEAKLNKVGDSLFEVYLARIPTAGAPAPGADQ